MKKYNALFYFLIISAFVFIAHLQSVEKAVICVPIADLIGQSLHSLHALRDTYNSYNLYQQLPVCGEKNAHISCPRLHQLIYNDVVEIIKREHDEVCIQIPNLYYLTASDKPQTTYWTHRDNIRSFDDLTSYAINIDHIPQPINFTQPATLLPNNHTVTLTQPHYDAATKQTFSIGTRFIKASLSNRHIKNKISVYAIDYKKNKECIIFIPHTKCINSALLTTPEQQIAQFVSLLKLWAHQENGCIPYVWGGTSFTSTMNTPFQEKTHNTNNSSWYEFDNDVTIPKNGFDCSGVIARAAQICGMPYFFKNTTTISKMLTELQTDDCLQNGDIILIKGHVMVVSNVAQNKLIEARSYAHGYGKLHEIKLHKVFDEMYDYQELCNAFFNKKTLKRKDVNGKIRDTFKDWKILTIRSIYQKY